MNEPYISVVIPVYNVEGYLEKCIQSVLSQSHSSYDIVLVDDGSTDQSGGICDEYAKMHPDKIRVIHQENHGLGGARNVGMAEAKGDYILFVDSDDTISPDALERLWEAAVLTDHPDMLVFSASIVDEHGKHTGRIHSNQTFLSPFCLQDKPRALFDPPSAWIRMVKKTLYTDNAIQFPPRLWFEDLYTTPKLLSLAERIVYVDAELYRYLVRAGSIINSGSLLRQMEILEVFDHLQAYFRENHLIETYRDELEFLAIHHILFRAMVRVIKIDVSSEQTRQLREYMQTHFPDWKKNPYLPGRPLDERLAISLTNKGALPVLSFLLKLKANMS